MPRSSSGRSSRPLLCLVFAFLFSSTALPVAGFAQPIVPRVINGQSVPDGQAAWMGSLHLLNVEPDFPLGGHFCGAFLIHPQYALTAGHCVYAYRDLANQLAITFGRTTLSNHASGVSVALDSIQLHPNYNDSTLAYDLAVLKLASTVQITPLPLLTNGGDLDAGGSGAVYGWGVYQTGIVLATDYSDVLQTAAVPIPDAASCSAAMGPNLLPASMMCAGRLATDASATDGIDTCSGDSGGPLIATLAGTARAVGISSWGYECASYRYYGVYSRLDAVLDWINAAVPIAVANVTAPALSGVARIGETLNCSAGAWEGASAFQYLFETGKGAALQSSSSQEYLITKADKGKTVRCTVTASGAGGSASASSAYTAAIGGSLDTKAPVVTRVRRSCKARSCTLTVSVRDGGEDATGVISVRVRGDWRGQVCSAGRCTQQTRGLKFTVSEVSATQFSAIATAPKKGFFRTRTRALDRAGNISKIKYFNWTR